MTDAEELGLEPWPLDPLVFEFCGLFLYHGHSYVLLRGCELDFLEGWDLSTGI